MCGYSLCAEGDKKSLYNLIKLTESIKQYNICNVTTYVKLNKNTFCCRDYFMKNISGHCEAEAVQNQTV